MHPILFEIGSITFYSYGCMIGLGAIAGMAYLVTQGKREVGLTFDQANALFLYLFAAAFIGGKIFLFFEAPSYYAESPGKLLSGRGFVFYGSFLFAVPAMIWYFRKHKFPLYTMLDIMAVTTCLVHIFGRLGCFLAGCCYGKPTDWAGGVTYTHEACSAPKNVALHPVQLYEMFFIFAVILFLLYRRSRKKFAGELFLSYLILYALGRFVIEFFRGDSGRGFVAGTFLSHGQGVALVILVVAIVFFFYKRKKR